jgi:hypothetical protein
MSTRSNENQKSALALAIAAGTSVPAWARENRVAQRTAYTWSRSEEVLEQVQRIRRRAMDRAIGRLARNATRAADQITRLARTAKSEAVRLQASRAVLAELMAVSNYASIEDRLAEVEKKLGNSCQLPVPGSQPDRTASSV